MNFATILALILVFAASAGASTTRYTLNTPNFGEQVALPAPYTDSSAASFELVTASPLPANREFTLNTVTGLTPPHNPSIMVESWHLDDSVIAFDNTSAEVIVTIRTDRAGLISYLAVDITRPSFFAIPGSQMERYLLVYLGPLASNVWEYQVETGLTCTANNPSGVCTETEPGLSYVSFLVNGAGPVTNVMPRPTFPIPTSNLIYIAILAVIVLLIGSTHILVAPVNNGRPRKYSKT